MLYRPAFSPHIFDIINSTATGKNEPCDFPDIRDFWADIFMPCICMVSAIMFSYGPYFLSGFLGIEDSLLNNILLVLGSIHFPMAVLNVAISQNALAAFWPYTIKSIRRCPLQYAVFLIILMLIGIINIILDKILHQIPIIGWFTIFLLLMYSLMLQGRMLGLFYRENQDKLY